MLATARNARKISGAFLIKIQRKTFPRKINSAGTLFFSDKILRYATKFLSSRRSPVFSCEINFEARVPAVRGVLIFLL